MAIKFDRFTVILFGLAIAIFAIEIDSGTITAAEPLSKRTGVDANQGDASRESDYYRIVSIATPPTVTDSRDPNWKPAEEGIALEVSGIAILDDRRVAVSIRKGEVWILDHVYDDDPHKVTFHQFASALHEPLGLLKWKDSLITVQRTEMTQMIDIDGDEVADRYETLASGWGVSGNYHEYAYGPQADRDGNLWLTLNIGMGIKGDQRSRCVNDPVLKVSQPLWRGWAMKREPDGTLSPVCAGMRSPSGIGANAQGDLFYTDQQGNWVATNSLHHLREGVFFHHPESLASMTSPGSTIEGVKSIPDGLPYPEALKQFPQMRPPAVWFPYKKMGQSTTDILLDQSGGKFGPFAGQLFVGEFTQAAMNRVFLEKVDGEYQGACFPFRRGFASAVFRMAQGTDGSLFVGLTNRGWSSLGTASYGLQRLVWTGKVPFEILEIRAKPDGFELQFTRPVDPVSAANPDSYRMNSYTYLYHKTYGSDEIQNKTLTIDRAIVAKDRLSVRLYTNGLRRYFVHELDASGIRDANEQPLLHSNAFYTLNSIPKAAPETASLQADTRAWPLEPTNSTELTVHGENFTGALDEIQLIDEPLDASQMEAAYKPVSAIHEVPDQRQPFTLWTGSGLPKTSEAEILEDVQFHVIKKYEPDVDGYGFLHGVALAWHKGKLYASFAHNKGEENTHTEEARYCVSEDGGKSWSKVQTIDAGVTDGDLAVSHGVFLSHEQTLWAFLGAFYGTRERVHTRAYTLDEDSGRWQRQGTVVEDGFWPMTEPVKMMDGSWIMPGFVAEQKNPAAVAICPGNLKQWKAVVIPRGERVGRMWGESSVIVDGPNVTNIARYGAQAVALAATSEDYGRTWTPSIESNLPMATSKPCSGILSNAQRYLIGSTTADGRGRRSPLTIAVSKPGESTFSRLFVIRHAMFPEGPGESIPNAGLSYPYAVEHQGKLYVGYSNNGGRRANHNSAELAIIPIASLAVGDSSDGTSE